MKAVIEKIDLHDITRDDARKIRNELNQLTNGALSMYPDKYPALVELDALLNGCFDAMKNGVHIISKRD
jgi:hypothetical protein